MFETDAELAELVRTFQHQNGLAETGFPDLRTMAAMEKAASAHRVEDASGVAGSRVVPTTMIGAEPFAWMG